MANTAVATGASTRPNYGSMSRDRTWALRWSYFFLVLFAIFFLLFSTYPLVAYFLYDLILRLFFPVNQPSA